MTISMTKGLALCGLCALLAGAGSAASAQGYDHPWHHEHHARYAIMRAKMAYGRAMAHGNYRAAERAHLRARAIRHHIRAHREMEDHGY